MYIYGYFMITSLCLGATIFPIFTGIYYQTSIRTRKKPWFRTSFHENAWNMANRSNFVKIVICVSFLDAYIIFLRAPSINRQKHITQLERNFAQLERNLKK